MKILNKIAVILLVVGGLNWGLVGFVQLDLVKLIFGSFPLVQNTVYVLVGISALVVMMDLCGCCRKS